MTQHEMLRIVQSQLATDLNCSPDDFNRDGFVFCEAKENPGRRPFPRGERHFDMLTMGSAVIVSATPDILPFLREQLDGKNRYDAFNMPFVHGQGLYFLPDNPQPLPMPNGFEVKRLERNEIMKLYDLYQRDDFSNAIQFDPNHPRPDVLAVLAMEGGKAAGMAGASADCGMMWQIGIDVRTEYRNRGIAAALTNRLAIEILERGKIPYYAAAICNIASQRTAYRAGFKPAWACVYRGRFDDTLTSPTG
ncbi:MAG: GNAT family N-acetyltransferase [Oscillospiraceae bacterium]|nr:GNAT family N-acetyltransferase [Oscillospiraceae bacterium]